MSARDSVWHVPFKGLHASLSTAQILLWQHDNVYVMDNHRAAMWLDYFFCADDHDNLSLMFSDGYVDAVFQGMRAHRDAGRVACLTLCLTPDEGYTGGWGAAEALCARARKILNVPLALPPRLARDTA